MWVANAFKLYEKKSLQFSHLNAIISKTLYWKLTYWKTSTRVVNFCLKNYIISVAGGRVAGCHAEQNNIKEIASRKRDWFLLLFFSLSFEAKLENGCIPRTSNIAMGEDNCHFTRENTIFCVIFFLLVFPFFFLGQLNQEITGNNVICGNHVSRIKIVLPSPTCLFYRLNSYSFGEGGNGTIWA